MISKFNLMHEDYYNVLENKYKIIGIIEFKQFDYDWNYLREFFLKTKKQTFDTDERYIIVHQDTDIYLPNISFGINFRNFLQIVEEVDIPFYTLLIWTNHFGIQKEIDILCKNHHPKDRPDLIESFYTTTHAKDEYKDIDLDLDAITHHAICMMGQARSHRHAVYHALKHIDKNKLAMTLNSKHKHDSN